MSRNVILAVAVVLGLAACSSVGDARPDTAGPDDPIVHEAGTEIGFQRKCADAEPFRVQAFGAFRSEDGRARALAKLHARRHAVRREEVFVGMQLVAMHVDGAADWADAPFAIRMEAHAAGRGIIGADHTEYNANPEPGVGERRVFRTDAGGRMAWLDFIEPTEPEGAMDRSYNWSPEFDVTATELGLTESVRRVLLGLTLTHLGTGDEMRLTGPALRVPDRIWNETPPKPRTLGLFETLNPLDEGSVWAWLSNAARYGHCVDERRYAKRWFRDGASTDPAAHDVLQASD